MDKEQSIEYAMKRLRMWKRLLSESENSSQLEEDLFSAKTAFSNVLEDINELKNSSTKKYDLDNIVVEFKQIMTAFEEAEKRLEKILI